MICCYRLHNQETLSPRRDAPSLRAVQWSPLAETVVVSDGLHRHQPDNRWWSTERGSNAPNCHSETRGRTSGVQANPRQRRKDAGLRAQPAAPHVDQPKRALRLGCPDGIACEDAGRQDERRDRAGGVGGGWVRLLRGRAQFHREQPGQNPGGRNRAEQGGPLERSEASGRGRLRESAHRDARQSFRRAVRGGQGGGVEQTATSSR